MMSKIFTAIFLILFATNTRGQIIVIGNLTGIESLSATQVEDIFMGRMRSQPNGRMAAPIDYIDLRAEFYQKLVSRPIEQIDAYWARISFSGMATAPLKLTNDEEVLSKVTEDKDAIGYIDEKSVKITTQNSRTIGIVKKDTRKKIRVLLTLN